MTRNHSAHHGDSFYESGDDHYVPWTDHDQPEFEDDEAETADSYYDGWTEEDALDHQSFVRSQLALAAQRQAEAARVDLPQSLVIFGKRFRTYPEIRQFWAMLSDGERAEQRARDARERGLA